MAASEETYRSQPTLHVVFAISSIAMTAAIVWMILADHNRPWKTVQREFQVIERQKLEADKAAQEKKVNEAEKKAAEADIAKAQQTKEQNTKELRALKSQLDKATGLFQKLDTAKKFQKAELDSQRSLYDGMIDLGQESEAKAYIRSTIQPSEKRLNELTVQYDDAKKAMDELLAKKETLEGNIDVEEKKLQKLMADVDRVERVLKQKGQQYGGDGLWSTFLANVRGLPVIDLAAPPTKIQQISLPELTIDYNFKDVPRYDRCTTCHQGIDRLNYDKDANGEKMKAVFASHPFLANGTTALNAKGEKVPAGLYLDANGPHPINKFGCTICHGGQGSGTDFTFSSHTPSDLHEKEEWEKQYHWHEMHHWDEPMLPTRFVESSCLKCHHQVTDIPQAKKLQAGYERIVKFGCTGCHTIGGEGIFGPNLTDERPVGPNLSHVGTKVSKEWLLKWVKNPHHFRPDTRMPRFYDVTNNSSEKDEPKVQAEVQAITHYLIAKSTPATEFVAPNAKGVKDSSKPAALADANANKGKELFLQKGCMACHAHKEHGADSFPDDIKKYAKADYGPNLSELAAKFASPEQGYAWLVNWIKSPEAYHPKSLMPNLQISWEDSADIAAWLVSVKGAWKEDVKIDALDSKAVQAGLDELVTLYKKKTMPLSEVAGAVKSMKTEDKLLFVGERTISRLGCYGCHNVPGFENAKPIGTPLDGWGIKSPAKLDYGHIAEYLSDQPKGDHGDRDGTDEYYQEQLSDHTRMGFLYQKLHRPRSYDYKKTNEDLKAWDDRLRMPQFVWANDPAAVEEVMTFVLGLTTTREKMPAKFQPGPNYTASQKAVAEGAKLINRYNCQGCHVLEMPKYTLAAGGKFDEVFTDFATNVKVSYNKRNDDYLKAFYPKLTYDAKAQPVVAEYSGEAVTIEGMPISTLDNEVSVALWRPVTIRGYTFNVGDTVTLDRTKAAFTPAVGGDFAWLYAGAQVAKDPNADFASFWNRLPPPLLREGLKVQTPWLTGFLKDPYSIRPAVNLRMPKFHYGKEDRLAAAETEGIANYFAAVDGAEFPYQQIPQREQAYLAGLESKHKDYLGGGWSLMTKGACIQCHAVGQYKPTGTGQTNVNGPDLRQVANRFRPGYLGEWLANPARLVPYTAMPQNIKPHGDPAPGMPKSMAGQPLTQVEAMRDTLLNYVTAVESQLATTAPAPAATPAPGGAVAPKPAGTSGGGR